MTDDRDRELVGEKIKAFLADEDVTACFTMLEREAMRKFKVATTDDERRYAQALSNAVDALAVELARMVNEGTLANHDREQRDRAPVTR